MEEIKEKSSNKLYELLIVLINIAAVTIINIILKAQIIDFVKDYIFIGLLTICLIYCIELDCINERMLFNNQFFIKRYFISYYLFTILACICVFLPKASWVFLAIFVGLALFSSINVGFISGLLLLTMCALLTGDSGFVYFEYALAGIVGIILFSSLTKEFNVHKPIILSLLFQLITILIAEILLSNQLFSFNQLIIPVINILICALILIFVLKLVSNSFIYETTDRLVDVIDLEFELLTELKNTSKEEYDNTLYTAVLCSKMANNMGLNENLCKALGYYYHIGLIKGDNSWDTVSVILNNNDMPSEVSDLLKEYLDEKTPIKSRETVVLLFADTVVSSIKYLLTKDKNAQIDYDKLIGAIFDKKLKSGILNDTKISFEDVNIMRNTLINEKLFYDFLRG